MVINKKAKFITVAVVIIFSIVLLFWLNIKNNGDSTSTENVDEPIFEQEIIELPGVN